MSSNSSYMRKYFIMGSQDVPADKDAVEILQQAIQAGITVFEFRELGQDQLFGLDKIKLGTDLRKICKQHDIPFIVNNDIQMLHLLDADGIRVNQAGTDVDQLRKQIPNKKIGLTISSELQENGSELALIDFIATGPIYEDLPRSENKEPIGLDLIKQLRYTYPTIHLVAFGGINQTNAKEVIEAGASGVAVVSTISEAGDSIKEVVEEL